MKEVKSILMVCLGNICRSPLAEGIMRAKIQKYNLSVMVDSAGTAGYHIGENPDPRSIANAKKNGIDISKLKARQFSIHDFDVFDKIFVMDQNNFKDVSRLTNNELHLQKVSLILENQTQMSYNIVPDPYYGKEMDFQLVFDLLDEACENIAQSIHKHYSIKA